MFFCVARCLDGCFVTSDETEFFCWLVCVRVGLFSLCFLEENDAENGTAVPMISLFDFIMRPIQKPPDFFFTLCLRMRRATYCCVLFGLPGKPTAAVGTWCRVYSEPCILVCALQKTEQKRWKPISGLVFGALESERSPDGTCSFPLFLSDCLALSLFCSLPPSLRLVWSLIRPCFLTSPGQTSCAYCVCAKADTSLLCARKTKRLLLAPAR